MLKKGRLVTDAASDIDSVFSEANRVRNSCAHTDPEKDLGHPLLDRDPLLRFITSTEDMIAAIQKRL